MCKCLLIALLTIAASQSEFIADSLIYGQFPDKFIWAVATAAYQVEGAWNVSGKCSPVNFLNFGTHYKHAMLSDR